MKQNTFSFTDQQGYKIFTYQWRPEETEPKAIIILVHGMAEHAGRYQRFAESLTSAGYLVFAPDHRGHGLTAGNPEKVGYMGEDGFNNVVTNLHQLSQLIQNENPGLPLVLFGHSFGSFLTQQYIEEYGHELRGAVLSGTCGKKGGITNIGLLLAWLIVHGNAPEKQSPFLHNMALSGYNSKFQPQRTDFDWLSRDNAEVDRYINDPFCGAVLSGGFYYDLARALKRIHCSKNQRKIPNNLPIYIIAGTDDPVGEYGKGVQRLIFVYQQAGLNDLTYKFYPGGRHEMPNEINRDEVIRDLFAWLDRLFI